MSALPLVTPDAFFEKEMSFWDHAMGDEPPTRTQEEAGIDLTVFLLNPM